MKQPTEAPVAFQEAWNSHDMSALAALFCDDATFVNRFGHYVRGVAEIAALHQPIHETIYLIGIRRFVTTSSTTSPSRTVS